LIEETYPSGKIVRNFFENDGDLAKVVRSGKTYVSDFDYNASGGIKSLKLGNGLYETAEFSSRQQMTQIGLGSTPTNNNLWKVNYYYGELAANGVDVLDSKNTGNIAKLVTTLPNVSFTQTYRYDALERIKEAKETSGTTETWKQTYNYDRFGNRNSFSQAINNQPLTINNQTLPSVNPNNNRFNDGQGFQYDKTGNIVQDIDKLTGFPRNFVFNGDNKQVHVKDSYNQTVGAYFYDGNGQRVKKVTNSETTIFVYDAGGKLVAEYSTETSQNPTVSYTVTDTLGSPRVIVDKQGNIVSRRDFLPFGEEIGVDTPQTTQRASIAQYNTQDTIRQKFTGYEKDKETRLDYAQARYYNSQYGRFTAVDPLLASGKSANPQTFNRYVYTMNRPLNHTDTTGLQTGEPVEPINFLGQMYKKTIGKVDYFYDHKVKGSSVYNGNPVVATDRRGWKYNIIGGSDGGRRLVKDQKSIDIIVSDKTC
jgi:RHS repeat-associated protein